MLARRERYFLWPWHLKAEDMLGIVCHAGCVAVPPLGIDLEAVLPVPIGESVPARIEAGLFCEFALRRLRERLAFMVAACYRLPGAGPVCTLA